MNFFSEPWYIFTDASYETGGVGRSKCGIGGVIFDSLGCARSCFSSELPHELKLALGESRSSQIILEAEMLTGLVALVLWKRLIEGDPRFSMSTTTLPGISSSQRALGPRFRRSF